MPLTLRPGPWTKLQDSPLVSGTAVDGFGGIMCDSSKRGSLLLELTGLWNQVGSVPICISVSASALAPVMASACSNNVRYHVYGGIMYPDGTTNLDHMAHRGDLHAQFAPSIQWLSHVYASPDPTLGTAEDAWVVVDVPIDEETAAQLMANFGRHIVVDRRMVPAHIVAMLTRTERRVNVFDAPEGLPIDAVVEPGWLTECCNALNGAVVADLTRPSSRAGMYEAFRLQVSTGNIIEARKHCNTAVLDSRNTRERLAIKVGRISCSTKEEAHISREMCCFPGGYWAQVVAVEERAGWHAMAMQFLESNVYTTLRKRTISPSIMSLLIADVIGGIGIVQHDMLHVTGRINMDWRTPNMAFATITSSTELPCNRLPIRLFDAGLVASKVEDITSRTDSKEGPKHMYQWMNDNMEAMIDAATYGIESDTDLVERLYQLRRCTKLHEFHHSNIGICLNDTWQNVSSKYAAALYSFSCDLWRHHGHKIRAAREQFYLYAQENDDAI